MPYGDVRVLAAGPTEPRWRGGPGSRTIERPITLTDDTQRLGASRLTEVAQQEFGQTWYVMADPEGNEFCVARESR
jgi:hypothetical protein